MLKAGALQLGDKLEGLEGDEGVVGTEFSNQECVQIILENGHCVETSRLHMFLLASGGYVTAEASEGRVLCTAEGTSRVISVLPTGTKEVLKIKLSNAHAYLTNGIWSLE